MSTLSDQRDMIAAAHLDWSTLEGKTASIYDKDGALVHSNLYCVARGLNKQERDYAAIRGIDADMTFEFARQGAFTGVDYQPHKYKILYANGADNSLFYEIINLVHEDTHVLVNNKIEAGVFVFLCKRADPGVGVMA